MDGDGKRECVRERVPCVPDRKKIYRRNSKRERYGQQRRIHVCSVGNGILRAHMSIFSVQRFRVKVLGLSRLY